MWTSFRRTVAASIDLLLPPACLLCGELLPTDHSAQSFCHDCSANISPLEATHCSLCAQPFPDSTSTHLCGICLKRPPSFSIVHAAGSYQGTIKNAVQRLKYRNQVTLARPLGQLIGNVVKAAGDEFIPDYIVPVPLHPDRLRRRGYNQALELARPIARLLGVPVNTSLLQRIRKTPQQQGLSAIERRSNLHNAFDLTMTPSAERILLVDDVMTTGETVRECCRTLLTGDIMEVQVAVVGRA